MQCRDKQHNLRRLEAQRNELNTKGLSPRYSRSSASASLFCKSRPSCTRHSGWLPQDISAISDNRHRRTGRLQLTVPTLLTVAMALQCGNFGRNYSSCKSRAATWARSSR